MPAHNKGLTWAFALRATDAEKERVRALVEEYATFDIKISMNDAVRIFIGRGSTPPPTTVQEARDAIERHWAECSRCDEKTIGCPEGRFVKVAYDRTPKLVPRAVRPAPPAPLAGDRESLLAMKLGGMI